MNPELPHRPLEKNQIHLWRIPLLQKREQGLDFREVLSPDELQRTSRFIQDLDRQRYAIGRGSLRIILSTYTQIKPEELVFEYGLKNKPSLSQDRGQPQVSFNLSHSQDLALIAITPMPRRVGVDLEKLRPLTQRKGIVERYFSETEQMDFNSLPPDLRERAFFNLWCRKEAFIKALGESIGTFPLNQLEVTFAPHQPAEILKTPSNDATPKNWFIQDLDLESNYAGCLVAEKFEAQEALSLKFFNFV